MKTLLFAGLILGINLISVLVYGQDITMPSPNLETAILHAYTRLEPRVKLSTAKPNYVLSTQDSLKTVVVKTNEGNEFVGKLVEETSSYVKLETTTYGLITLQKINIKSIKEIKPDNIIQGVFWEDHMQSTRYFWQPNGYGLKKGEAYYQNVWIFFNQISVGVTDNFLLGGGLIPLFLIAGSPTPVWITPKVSFPVVKNKFNLGAGALLATVIGETDTNLGIFYASATIGPRDKNFTIGAGYGYAGGSWATRPTFSANFMSRVGAKGYFLMENYVIGLDGQYGVLSMIGGRSIIGNGAGLDYGLVFPLFPDLATFVAIPWLGITLPLSEKGRP